MSVLENSMSGENIVKKIKARDGYIDFIKGVLIFLVVWGHVISNCKAGDFYANPLFKFIYSFHMPLFMGVSGWLFYFSINKYRMGTGILRRCVQMLYPATVWGAILFGIRLIVWEGYMPKSLFLALKDLFVCIKEFWFLWSVVLNACAVTAIHKFLKSRLAKTAGYIIIFLSWHFIPKINNPVLIFMFPCYVFGFYMHHYKEKMNQKAISTINGVSFFGFVFMLMYYDTKHYIYTSGINPFISVHGFWEQICINVFRWVVAILGSGVMLVVLRNIYDGFLERNIINFFKYLGTISLEIYVIQKILVETLLPELMINHKAEWMKTILSDNEIIYNFIITPAVTIMFTILIGVFVKWISRNKIVSNVLFGRVSG